MGKSLKGRDGNFVKPWKVNNVLPAVVAVLLLRPWKRISCRHTGHTEHWTKDEIGVTRYFSHQVICILFIPTPSMIGTGQVGWYQNFEQCNTWYQISGMFGTASHELIILIIIIKWKSDWRSIEVVFINHGISLHDVYGGGGAVSREISKRHQFPKWSDMASKLVRYGLKTGLIWIYGLPYRTTLEIRSWHVF